MIHLDTNYLIGLLVKGSCWNHCCRVLLLVVAGLPLGALAAAPGFMKMLRIFFCCLFSPVFICHRRPSWQLGLATLRFIKHNRLPMHLEIKMYRLRDLVTSLAIFGRKQCSAGSGVVGTIKLAFVGFAASVFIVSCEKQEGDNGTLLAKQNQAELESLKAQLAQMRETNQNLSMSISAAFVMMHDYQSVGHEAVFDGNRPGGVVRLNTDSGFFLVSFKDAQPYLEGYRVTVELGNPLAADYDNAEIHVAWGGSEPSAYNEVLTNANALQKFNNAYQTWKNSLHSNDIPIPGRLFAGKWNKIQLVLSPAKPSDLGYVRIKLDTPSVSLKTAPQ